MKLSQLDPHTRQNVEAWLHGHYDAAAKAEIERLLKDNPEEIVNAFYTNLSFGTGGIRGIMGVGTNRINVYTVRSCTQGLANYLNKQKKPEKGHSVFISHDCRHNSRLFAEETAKVFAANGIHVHLTKDLRPTPFVSFGCRYYKCSAAVMITASHNPSEYNGYKAYWSDGAQALPPHDQGIIEEVSKITDTNMVSMMEDLNSPRIELVDEELDHEYVRQCASLQTYPEENQTYGKDLKVVYSPLYGTGITLVPPMLKTWGFHNYTLVEAQSHPDGAFPTVKSPNPEEREAMAMGIEIMEKLEADLLTATDPDGDRVGVAVRHENEAVLLTGGQIACLCLKHVCEGLKKKGTLPEKAAFIKTIVTTELFQEIASSYGKTCFNVLTGFKYIAQLIRQWERDPDGYQYVFGGEESYGYLRGTLARDKDAIVSTALICEAALHAKREGLTLIDKLHDLYREYGVFHEELISIKFPETKEGKGQMASLMDQLFLNPPKKIAGIAVDAIEDYRASTRSCLKTGKTEPITLPKSNVLLFWLSDRSKLVIRPSGTEPKIKVYVGVQIKEFPDVGSGIQLAKKKAKVLLESSEIV